MKNKTAPPGFTRFFRFAGLLPIGAGFAKRNDGPQCPPQAKKNWDLGCVLYKKHKPPRGVSARRRRKIFGHLGGVVHKNHVAGMHSGTCFWRKTPPKILKIFRLRRNLEKTPPYWKRINNKGGFFSRFWLDFRILIKKHPQNFSPLRGEKDPISMVLDPFWRR